jgi:hypothetical protein
MWLTFLMQMFQGVGFHGVDCEMRARIFLHYEVAEPSIFLAQSKAEREELGRLGVKMLTSKPGDHERGWRAPPGHRATRRSHGVSVKARGGWSKNWA